MIKYFELRYSDSISFIEFHNMTKYRDFKKAYYNLNNPSDKKSFCDNFIRDCVEAYRDYYGIKYLYYICL